MYQDFSDAYDNNTEIPMEDNRDMRACGCGSPMQQWQGAMPAQGGMQGQIPMQGYMQTQYNINQPGTIPQGQGIPAGAGIATTEGLQQQGAGPSAVPNATFSQAPGSPVYQGVEYIQGYLRTLVGRYVKIDFLVGTNSLVDREGILIEVGVSYVVLRESQTDDNLMCDIFSIKFVRVYY